MIVTIDEALEDVYKAKITDSDCEDLEPERLRFMDHLNSNLKFRVFDMRDMQAGMNVICRLPKIFRIRPDISILHMHGNLIRDSGLPKILQLIQANPNVRVLDIGANDISDCGVVYLGEMLRQSKVTSLLLGCQGEASIQENRFGREGLCSFFQVMRQTDSLKCLGIRGLGLSHAGPPSKASLFPKELANVIGHCSNLENLDISKCGLIDADQRVLAEGFTCCQNLSRLWISSNSFSRSSEVVAGICTLDKLRALDLSDCQLTAESCNAITNRFSLKSWGLIVLNLAHNPIGSAAISRLLDVLCANHTLVDLNLTDTGIKPDVSESLRKFLQGATVLSRLDLSKNNIGDDAAVVFSEVFPHQDTLVSLSLASTRLTDSGAMQLCSALVYNSCIKRVSFKDNFLSEQGAIEMIEILQGNESLRHVDLSCNQIDRFALEAMEILMTRNKRQARDRHLDELRARYIRLSIQKAKVPVFARQLNSLRNETNALHTERLVIDDRIAVCELETGGTLETCLKSIDDLEKVIEEEKASIAELDEKMKVMREEMDLSVSETRERIQEEMAEYRKADDLAQNGDRLIEEVNENGKKRQEEIEADIRKAEEMLKEVKEHLADPVKLRKWEIPEYPWGEAKPTEMSRTGKVKIQTVLASPERTPNFGKTLKASIGSGFIPRKGKQ
jgi:Ran GTPase-activating protein (RanGAP) involved in mRNA processing and transport